MDRSKWATKISDAKQRLKIKVRAFLRMMSQFEHPCISH
jgi:hypothetical protein